MELQLDLAIVEVGRDFEHYVDVVCRSRFCGAGVGDEEATYRSSDEHYTTTENAELSAAT